MQLIESVRFETFKVLQDVELCGLQRLNVLVGPSGVGKTSVLEGLELLGKLVEYSSSDQASASNLGPLRMIFGDGLAPQRLMTRGHKAFEVRAVGIHPLRLRAFAKSDTRSWDATVYEVDFGDQVIPIPSPSDDIFQSFSDHKLQHWRDLALLQLNPRSIKQASKATLGSQPMIDPDGAGLPTALVQMAASSRETLESIEHGLRSILGNTGRIRGLPTPVQQGNAQVPGYTFELEVEPHGYVPADLLSEGTLLMLGLLAVIHQPNRPSLLLLDDLDRGLHPSAQAKLIAGLRILIETYDLQILATSHSPYLLDNFEAEEVQVMTFTPEGHVAAARLDTHPEWLEWKGQLQTGEFWATVGEDWVGATR